VVEPGRHGGRFDGGCVGSVVDGEQRGCILECGPHERGVLGDPGQRVTGAHERGTVFTVIGDCDEDLVGAGPDGRVAVVARRSDELLGLVDPPQREGVVRGGAQ
jgi:hypothetical protein